MIVFPAIDLYEGKVVRLSQGDFDKLSDYSLCPIDTAKSYYDKGCKYLHVVDLEGAKKGHPCHLKILEALAKIGLFIQYGGGLRELSHVKNALQSGADRIMATSIMFKDDEMPRRLIENFGDKIMPALDVKGGQVVKKGWTAGTGMTAAVAVDFLTSLGYGTFLVTGVEQDGSLAGPCEALYEPLVSRARIVAAGGVTTIADVRKLEKMGLDGAVVGKSLYEGYITIEEIIEETL